MRVLVIVFATLLAAGCGGNDLNLAGTPLEALARKSGARAPYVVETPAPTPATLDQTIADLLAAVEADRAADILRHVDPEITVSYAVDGTGHGAFAKTWRGGDARPWQPFLKAFLPALRDGGTATPSGGFLFPHHAAILRGDIDRLGRPTHDAPLLAAPDLTAANAATAGTRTGLCERVLCRTEGDWARLTMPNGVAAYTPSRALRPVRSTIRAEFERDPDGSWRLVAFVSGD